MKTKFLVMVIKILFILELRIQKRAGTFPDGLDKSFKH